MIHYRKIQQNADRIARTLNAGLICRTLLRSVFMWMIDRQGMVTDRHD